MGRKPAGHRVIGPYTRPDGRWTVAEIAADGTRTDSTHPSEGEATAYRDVLRAELARNTRTAEEAIQAYEQHLVAKGNKPKSYKETCRRCRLFFGDLALEDVTPAKCAARYQQLAAEYSADTHRNILAEVRTFCRWLMTNGWLRHDPLLKVQGVGRRKHGKPQLRIDEARLWLVQAWKLAKKEPGVVAALCTILLGLRASEVIGIAGRDVDDKGRLLWIADAKTPAGKRTLEIPPRLRPLLLALVDGPTAPIFGHHDRKWPTTWVAHLCELAGVPRVTAHGMRGLRATLGVLQSRDFAAVAADMGHEDFTTTAQSYAAPGTVDAATGARALRVLLGGKR